MTTGYPSRLRARIASMRRSLRAAIGIEGRIQSIRNSLALAVAELKEIEQAKSETARDAILSRGRWLTPERRVAMWQMIAVEKMEPKEYCAALRAMPGPEMPSDMLVQRRARQLHPLRHVGPSAPKPVLPKPVPVAPKPVPVAPPVVVVAPKRQDIPVPPAPPPVPVVAQGKSVPFQMGATRGVDPRRAQWLAERAKGHLGRV